MSAAAAIVLANAMQRNQQEEESMTNYSAMDLHEQWEFKIVRAFTTQFKDPVQFRKLVDEEFRAGWQLVEKFDDSRVRFKRPAQAKSNDVNLPLNTDPYRTFYGINPATRPGFYLRALLIIFLLTAAVLLPVGAFTTYMEHRSLEDKSQNITKNLKTLSADISQTNKEILEMRIRTLDARLHVLEVK